MQSGAVGSCISGGYLSRVAEPPERSARADSAAYRSCLLPACALPGSFPLLSTTLSHGMCDPCSPGCLRACVCLCLPEGHSRRAQGWCPRGERGLPQACSREGPFFICRMLALCVCVSGQLTPFPPQR